MYVSSYIADCMLYPHANTKFLLISCIRMLITFSHHLLQILLQDCFTVSHSIKHNHLEQHAATKVARINYSYIASFIINTVMR